MTHMPKFSPRDKTMAVLKGRASSRPSTPDLDGEDVPVWMSQAFSDDCEESWGALNPTGTKLPTKLTTKGEDNEPISADMLRTAGAAAPTHLLPTPGPSQASVTSPSISPPCSPTVRPKSAEFDLPDWIAEVALKKTVSSKGWGCFGTTDLPTADLPKLEPTEDILPPEVAPWLDNVPCVDLRDGWGGSLPARDIPNPITDDEDSPSTFSDPDLPEWMSLPIPKNHWRDEVWGVWSDSDSQPKKQKEIPTVSKVQEKDTDSPVLGDDIDFPDWMNDDSLEDFSVTDEDGWAVLAKSADIPLPKEKDKGPGARKGLVFANSDNVVKRAVRPVEQIAKSLEAGDETDKDVVAVVPLVDVAELHNQIKPANVVGMGGSGTVYKVSWNGQTVALKVLNGSGVSGKEAFVRELNMLSNLNSPYLVKLVAACVEPPCYVTPYYPLGSLHSFMQFHKKGLDLQLSLNLARDIARGLVYLHSRSIIHRDLKPANILLADSSGLRAKIADLGSARELGTTMTSQVGTFAYMAPELLEGKSAYGMDVDIHSFAFILYEMLEGSNPLIEMSVSDLCDYIRAGLRPQFDKREVPEQLKDVVCACWQPSGRPSAELLSRQLDSVAISVGG